MPKYGAAINTQRIPILGMRAEQAVVGSPPTTPVEGLFWHDTTNNVIKVYLGGSWQTLGTAGAGGPPSGAAGGDLTGSYPNPTIGAAKVSPSHIAATLIETGQVVGGTTGTAANATAALRRIGSNASDAASGTHVHMIGLSDWNANADPGYYYQTVTPATNAPDTSDYWGEIISITPNGDMVQNLYQRGGTKQWTRTRTGASTYSGWTRMDVLNPQTGDLTGTWPALTIGASKVNSSHIVDDSIVLADLNSALSGPAGNVFGLRKLIGGAGGATSALASDTRLNELAPATGQVSFNGQLATNMAAPVSGTDGANKNYVDGVAQGLDAKASVRMRVTSVPGAGYNTGTNTWNSTIGIQDPGGLTPNSGDRVLVDIAGGNVGNGIFVFTPNFLVRATDMDAWTEVPGAFTFVEEGTSADTGWVSTANQSGTLNTTTITWAQFSAAGNYTGGNGLTLTGTDFAVNVDSVGIEIAADTLRLKDSGVTSAKIADGTIVDGDVAAANKDGVAGTASMRTLGAGAQQAAAGNHNHSGTYEPVITALPVNKGGTGATSFNSALINLQGSLASSGTVPALTAGVWTTLSGVDCTNGVVTQFMDMVSPYEQVFLDVRQNPGVAGQLQVKADVAYGASTLMWQATVKAF